MDTKPSQKIESKRVKVSDKRLGVWFGGWATKPQQETLESLKPRIKRDYKRQ